MIAKNTTAIMAESMVTSTTWVPRGFAAQHPRRIQLDEAEYDRIAQLAKMQLEDAQEELKDAQDEGDNEDVDMEVDAKSDEEAEEKPKERKEKDDDDLAEYNLDDYDEPTEEEKMTGQCEFFWCACAGEAQG